MNYLNFQTILMNFVVFRFSNSIFLYLVVLPIIFFAVLSLGRVEQRGWEDNLSIWYI